MNKLNVSFKVVLAGLATALVGVGCAKSATDTPTVTAALAMTGSSQPKSVANYKKAHPLLQLFSPTAVAFPPPAMTDATTRVVTLNTAWIVVKEVEFKLAEVAGAGEVEGAEVKFRGPYFVDLLSTIPASFGSASVPAGVYRRVKMKLEKDSTLPAGAPAGLMGKSILLEGNVSTTAFSYTSTDGTEFKIAGPGGVNLSETANLMLGVKMSDLFRMINMDAVVAFAGSKAISEANRIPAAGACPLIENSSNDIYTCIRKGLEKAGKFGKDSDNDGEIEVGEDEVQD